MRRVTPERLAQLDLSAWRLAFNGAEPVRATTLKRFADTFAPAGFRAQAFFPCYGMAEATLFLTGGGPSDLPVHARVLEDCLKEHRVVPAVEAVDEGWWSSWAAVGLNRAMKSRSWILKPRNDSRRTGLAKFGYPAPRSPRATGTVRKAPNRRFNAYITGDNETKYLRTGDLGFIQNGELFITGRLKDLIIIRGRNHYAHDIEWSAAQSHDALRAGCGAAFSVEVQGEERLVVAQELDRRKARKAPKAEIIRTIRSAVAENHELQAYAVVLLMPGRRLENLQRQDPPQRLPGSLFVGRDGARCNQPVGLR